MYKKWTTLTGADIPYVNLESYDHMWALPWMNRPWKYTVYYIFSQRIIIDNMKDGWMDKLINSCFNSKSVQSHTVAPEQ